MTPILSKPYYRSELDLLPTKSTNPETTNWRCLMASEGNGLTHYLVSKEVVLGEACIIEPCNEWISLAFIKLGIDRPEAVIPRAFVENHALVPKPRTNPLGLPTHKQQDPPNNSFHLCTVGGVCSCRLPCSPAKVTKVTKVTNI